VLTDFLGHAYGVGVMEPEFYGELTDAEIERELNAEERGE
jgi:hypothetical protein